MASVSDVPQRCRRLGALWNIFFAWRVSGQEKRGCLKRARIENQSLTQGIGLGLGLSLTSEDIVYIYIMKYEICNEFMMVIHMGVSQ
jgi:hypothetical protein